MSMRRCPFAYCVNKWPFEDHVLINFQKLNEWKSFEKLQLYHHLLYLMAY